MKATTHKERGIALREMRHAAGEDPTYYQRKVLNRLTIIVAVLLFWTVVGIAGGSYTAWKWHQASTAIEDAFGGGDSSAEPASDFEQEYPAE